MLDGSMLFEKYSTKWDKNTKKCSQQKEVEHIF